MKLWVSATRARTLMVVAFSFGLCGLATGQGSSIPLAGAVCPNSGPPGGTIGITDRYCFSFHAVAGERVQASCSAYGVASGIQYSMGCAVLIGPEGGNAFSVSGQSFDYEIPQTGDFVFEELFSGRHSFFASEEASLKLVSVPTCVGDANSLCLAGYRFRVEATFQQTPEGPSAPATAVPLTNDTGYFWFFDPTNIELVTKVLTGCGVNNEYWVFAGGLTDVGIEMKVTDTVTGAVKTYSNAFGTPFQPIQDSSAFPCP
jgi:hypothetical protein